MYVLTLIPACVDCNGSPAVSVELIEPSHILYREFLAGDWTVGELPFVQWPDSMGVLIQCGMLQHEFVGRLKKHLIGVDSRDYGDEQGKLDEAGAEVILEEMFEHAQVSPSIYSAETAS